MENHVLPALGRKHLVDVGPLDVKKLAADLAGKGLAPGSVRIVLGQIELEQMVAGDDPLHQWMRA